MSTDDQLAALIGQNTTIAGKQDGILTYLSAFLAGTTTDPDSFNETGGNTGDLGYYPLPNANGEIVYMPCLARQQAIATSAATAGVSGSITAGLASIGYPGAAVPAYALRLALGANVQAILNNLSADPTDPAAIRWMTSAPVAPTDALGTFVQSTLGLTADQLTALFTAARAAI